MAKAYLEEFKPPPRILLGAGPSAVHPRVLQAMTLPVISHLDPAFFQVMDDICEMLREVYGTTNFITLPLSSSGTGAMEAACANVLERGDTIVVCRNGFFGDRLAEIAQRCGAETYVVDTPWGQPVDVQALADELKRHKRVKAVGVVHAETSTGVLSPLKEIVGLAHQRDALVIVDAVTSLGGHQIRMDEWDLDVCYSASQKCLGAPPGLAPISLGKRAVEVVNTRSSKVQSFYFNLKDLETYWSQRRVYHHTSPISMTYALREALRMIMEEGPENRIRRHARVAAGLRAGLEALGIGLLADPDHRLKSADCRPGTPGYRRRSSAPEAPGRLQHRDWWWPWGVERQGVAHRPYGGVSSGKQCFHLAVSPGDDPFQPGLRSGLRLQPGGGSACPHRLQRLPLCGLVGLVQKVHHMGDFCGHPLLAKSLL